MSQIDDIDAKMKELKHNVSKDANLTTVAKLQKLQKQLEKLGISGQTLAAGSDADLNEYKAQIDSKSDIGTEAVDYGNVTIDMGEAIKKMANTPLTAHLRTVGRKIVRNGKSAVESGENTQQVHQEISHKNNQNLQDVSKKQNELQARTGVGEISLSENDNKSEHDEKNGENKAANQNSQDEKTPQEALAGGSMEEILKYKIRKGEDINANT